MNATTADAGSAAVTSQPGARQLRRSGDDRMLGGVAGGVADIDDRDVKAAREPGVMDGLALRYSILRASTERVVLGAPQAAARLGVGRFRCDRVRCAGAGWAWRRVAGLCWLGVRG